MASFGECLLCSRLGRAPGSHPHSQLPCASILSSNVTATRCRSGYRTLSWSPPLLTLRPEAVLITPSLPPTQISQLTTQKLEFPVDISQDHPSALLYPQDPSGPLCCGPRPTPALSPTSKLHCLEYLDLSHNHLAAVPAGLPHTLAVLHLGRNRIRQVEAARLHRAQGLRYLLLQHNQLGTAGLPTGALRPLRVLHTLHIYGNRLERVPLALPRRLRSLVLPHNRVAMLGARDLTSTPGLAELNLAYNRLVSARVHHRAFRRLRALRSLDLAGNQLTQLPPGLPTSLHTLRLQRNQLRALEPEPLAGLDQLQELSLAHNRLRVGDIGPGTWHELQALQVRGGLVSHTDYPQAAPMALPSHCLPSSSSRRPLGNTTKSTRHRDQLWGG